MANDSETNISCGGWLKPAFDQASGIRMEDSRFREVWEETPDGQLLCALVNGDVGWLMYLRSKEDPGFSSRNPEFIGLTSEIIEYRLNGGQWDEFPASWTYPVEIVEKALQFFRSQSAPPLFIHWHNDSEDGVVLRYESP